MTDSLQVSVVMGVYNGARYLVETIDSVLRQTFDAFEFLIIDDGSTDPQVTLILAEYADRDKRIQVVSRPNEGLTRALIEGCERASGSYIARVDVGDSMAPERLSAQKRALDSYPDCHLVSSAVAFSGPEWEPMWVNSGRPLSDEPISVISYGPDSGLNADIPHHGSVMFRKSAYDEAGGYRPQFYYGQDWDLWYRLAELGQFLLLPQVLYRARFFPDAISMTHSDRQRLIAALSLQAHCLRKAGRSDKAVLEQAAKIRPGQGKKITPARKTYSKGHYFIGEALRRRRNPKCRDYFKEAIKVSPFSARSWYRLAQSVPLMRQSVSLEPDDTDIMKRLLIVQNLPTQFDAPLYNKLADEAGFALTVVYTQTSNGSGPRYDAEIGRAPQWDHLVEERYERIDLNAVQARRPAEVVALIAARSPDLVLISGYYPPLHRKLVLPLKKLHLRVGLRSDNTLYHSNFSGIKGLVKKLVLPVWLRRYDTWHPVGTLAREYLEAVSRAQRPTYLFPYNVDNDWCAQHSQAFRGHRDSLLADMGFSAQSFVVLGIMKWHEREDPLVLIRAFRQLLDAKPEARLILVGDGPLRTDVEAMIGDIRDKVCLPGYAPYSELPKYYALADIFVHPAPSEPWGVSVNEAMACGVPVVVSSGVGAAADLVVEGETGFVFSVGDSAALARVLAGYAGSPSREVMRNACLKKMCDWSYEQSQATFQHAISGI